MTSKNIALNVADTGLGTPLVFLHGFPFSSSVWRKQVDAFRSSYRVIAPDLRGFGDSETLPGPTTMEQYAGDLHTLFVQQLSTGPVVLVGHSMGGYVALAFARQYPDLLRGLVLVSTKAGGDTKEAAAKRRATAETVKAEGVGAVIEAMVPKMLAAGYQDVDGIEQVRALMASSKPEGVIGALLGMAERPDATSMLDRINVPTLVVTGAEDTLIPPEESEKLAEAIRGAHLALIPKAGHLVAFEKPEEFNQALTEWLEREDLAVALTE